MGTYSVVRQVVGVFDVHSLQSPRSIRTQEEVTMLGSANDDIPRWRPLVGTEYGACAVQREYVVIYEGLRGLCSQ